MGALRDYFRDQPWQKRLLSLLITLIVLLTAVLVLYDRIAHRVLLHDLGSPDASVRGGAIGAAVALAARSQEALARLDRALATSSDLRFHAIATALSRLGKFDTPARDPEMLDRYQALQLAFARTGSPPVAVPSREHALNRLLLAGRDNLYVRCALGLACADSEPTVRRLGADLAARLGDDDALAALLGDGEPAVAAAAAVAAGLAGRTAQAERVAQLLAGSTDAEAVSGAAYALSLLRPKQCVPAVRRLLPTTRDARLLGRLLAVAGDLGDEALHEAVLALAARKPLPPAMALLAAGRMGLAAAAPAIRAVLVAAAGGDPPVLESQLLAAMAAAEVLELPVRGQVHAVCLRCWQPRLRHSMVTAARLLARQAQRPQPRGADTPSADECLRLLRAAALFHRRPATQPASRAAAPPETFLASAAAAAALWQIHPAGTYYKPRRQAPGPVRFGDELDRDSSAYVVMSVVESGPAVVGDYLAWHLGRTGRREAFELGLVLLPEPSAAPERKVYSDRLRSAGAMLLALSARTPGDRQQAAGRILQRLEGGPLGGEDDFFVRGAYECALLILGRRRYLPAVRRRLEILDFPQRRALTALLAAGDRAALDWLLLNPGLTDEACQELLVGRMLAEVLSAAAPELPRVDPAATDDVRYWQLRILRQACAIRRAGLKIGLRP